MTSDTHNQFFHFAAEHVNNGLSQEALAIFKKLMDTDLDDFGKTMACVNPTIVPNKKVEYSDLYQLVQGKALVCCSPG